MNKTIKIFALIITFLAFGRHLQGMDGYAELFPAMDNPSAIQKALDSGANINTQDKKHGLTPLTWAAQFNLIKVAELLINKNADLNMPNDSGHYTPLITAAMLNHIEIVKMLLDAGANIEIMDGFDATALLYAEEAGYSEIVKLIKDRIEYLGAVKKELAQSLGNDVASVIYGYFYN